jgi:hypothetical protein
MPIYTSESCAVILSMSFTSQVCKCCSQIRDEKSCNPNQFVLCEVCKRGVKVTVSDDGHLLCNECSRDITARQSQAHKSFDRPSPITFEVVISQTDDGLALDFRDSLTSAQHFNHGSHSSGYSHACHPHTQLAVPTPDCLAFSVMAHHACLPKPGFQCTVKLCFVLLTEKKTIDVPVDTVFLQVRHPMQDVMCKDGIAHTICPSWQIRWRGGSVKMCQTIPLQHVGVHRVDMSFTCMQVI